MIVAAAEVAAVAAKLNGSCSSGRFRRGLWGLTQTAAKLIDPHPVRANTFSSIIPGQQLFRFI
jgi:hypothetical protein